MKMKKVLKVVMMLFILYFSASPLEWQEIDHGVEGVVIGDIITVGEYEVAAIDEAPLIYRRKVGEEKWELVHDGSEQDEKHTFDREYRLVMYKGMLLGLFDEFSLRPKNIVSYDSGATWMRDTNFGLYEQRDIADATIARDTLVKMLDWKNRTIQACVDLDDGYKTIYSHGEEEVSAVALHDGCFYIGTWGRICKVSDFGDTQVDLKEGLPERTAVRDILVLDSLTIYASTDEGVYRSVDGGLYWRLVDPQFTAANFSLMDQMIYCDSSIYGMSKHKVFRLAPSDDRFSEILFPMNDQYDRIKLSILDDKLTIAGVDGVYEYDAGTGRLSLINNGLRSHPRVADLFTGERYIYATTFSMGGFHSLLRASADGSEWKSLLTVKGDSVAFGQNDNYLCLALDSAGEELYYYSRDYGTNWEKREKYNNPLYNGQHVDRDKDTLYHRRDFYDDYLVEFSIDSGHTWDTLITIGSEDRRFILKSGKKMFFSAGTYDMPLVTEDFGKTFSACSEINNRYTSLVKAADGTLLAGSIGENNISRDNGETWIRMDSSSAPTWGVSSLYDSTAVGYSKLPGDLMVGSPYLDKFYFSTNYCKSWTAFPGTNGRDSLSNSVTGAEVNRNASTIFCLEQSRLYKIDAKELAKGVSTIGAHTKNRVPNLCTTHLLPHAVDVQLQLTKEEQYSVELFTASGRLMLSRSGFAQRGTERLSFDRTGFAQGVYLLQVRAGKRTESMALVLQ